MFIAKFIISSNLECLLTLILQNATQFLCLQLQKETSIIFSYGRGGGTRTTYYRFRISRDSQLTFHNCCPLAFHFFFIFRKTLPERQYKDHIEKNYSKQKNEQESGYLMTFMRRATSAT
uniref:Secreted protein n=1 Tax=Lepeophtheirus salmonis TaxID=72036 RepID=A0A0K2V8I6_LEPSM